MSKDFDGWNQRKRAINAEPKGKLYHKRDIWWCSLGTNVGFEQDGTGDGYQRPALIVKGFSKNVCLVVPLTTSEKTNPYHVPIGEVGGRISFAIVSQLRLIDTRRLINKIGMLDQTMFATIAKAVRDFF